MAEPPLPLQEPVIHHMKAIDMQIDSTFSTNLLARGFLVCSASGGGVHKFTNGPFADTINGWEKTFFGPCHVWTDPRLHYATTRDAKFGVSVLGLCINPFDGASNNEQISRNLYNALSTSEDSFFDYVDQLSGSFVILYRLNDKVRILQDCAATKPVYFIEDQTAGTVISSHASLIGSSFGLKRDPRIAQVFENDLYKADPSRYLPGDITPFSGMKTLTANTMLAVDTGNTQRFFPRGPLSPRRLDETIITEVADIFIRQAEILAATKRPLMVAATAGRDSRVSVAAFAGMETTQLFSFHFPNTGHLSEDVEISQTIAKTSGIPLNIYDLSKYKDRSFDQVFKSTSPVGIWPAAALCYIREFPADAIHIRSTVSEIGRMFYGKRNHANVSPEALSASFTVTEFGKDPLVIHAMEEFILHADFSEKKFYNYNMYDMFYWEHRNSKWQNILCQEAEMASDVFIPYNNRRLIKLLLSVPEADRKAARIHIETTKHIRPDFAEIPYIS